MLKSRNDLLETKKAEIVSVIEDTISMFGEENICPNDIMQLFLKSGVISVTPPQQEPETIYMRMLVLDPLDEYKKGESIKPGNIKLNIRCLIKHLPDIVVSTKEIITDSLILKVCAALNIWKILWSVSTVKITKEQAIFIIALWNNCDQQKRIALERGYVCFKSLYEQIEMSKCTWELYIRLIDDLEKIHSIKLDDKGIWLCECVSKTYI